LLRWMYYAPDVVCLARKRAKADPFIPGEKEVSLAGVPACRNWNTIPTQNRLPERA
jgi:hypothetical protein